MRARIYSHLTGKRFLHLEDSLSLASPKIRIFMGEFDKGKGMKANGYHFLDLDDARVIFSDLAWGKPVEFVDYKGGPSGVQMISRVLKINCDAGKVWFQVQNGPGEKIGAGAVKPLGKAEVEIVVPFEIWEARKLGFAVLAYLQAWDVGRMDRRLETGDR